MLRIGELFAGYGGLGMGVQSVIGGEVVWFSEFDAAPSKILAHHWPDVPNHGDITQIDWSAVEPVDVLTGGFPCQDVSLAGARAGLKEGTRSGLWLEFAKAIDALRPGLVVIENVRGLLSAKTMEDIDEGTGDLEPDKASLGELGRGDRPVLNAFGRVCGDLAELGYDARWVGLRAADAGAPHARYRVFIIAQPADLRHEWAGAAWGWRDGLADGGELVADTHGPGLAIGGLAGIASRQVAEPRSAALGGDALAADPCGHEPERWGGIGDVEGTPNPREADGEERERVREAASDSRPGVGGTEWGAFESAIARWELVTGRRAPAPTKGDGRDGGHRLSAQFVEWLMGLPAGHVTHPAIGITRNEQLKALGNGVVWQQAALAVRVLLGRTA